MMNLKLPGSLSRKSKTVGKNFSSKIRTGFKKQPFNRASNYA